MRTAAALFFCCALAAAEPPRLVLLVAVDQMRPDTLTRFASEYTGGLKRLLEHGRRFEGELDHAATETGPGHSTMLTGCRPARTGIVANGWLDPRTLAQVYCVAGATPRLLLRDGLGDWMKKADARAKVFSVSGKDRSAILMGGRRPDGAFWFDKVKARFVTSKYYFAAGAPDWLGAFHADGWLEKLPDHWTYEPVESLRADDHPLEANRYSRASPHPLRAGGAAGLGSRLYTSPYLDAWTLRLATHLVERHDLGGDAAPDLLAVSLSATDIIGHSYGPFSQEIRDSTLRLDRELGAFFDALDRRGAPWVVAFTSDHGVLPVTDVRRVPLQKVQQQMAQAMRKRLGDGDWFRLASGMVYVNRAVARARGVAVEKVIDALRDTVLELDVTEAAFTRRELLGDGGGALIELARASWHADRSGDLFVIAKRNVLVTIYGSGTSHGSPYDYDRQVPLAFLGPGFRPGATGERGRTIDIAPTLAALLGIAVPADLDGKPLSRG